MFYSEYIADCVLSRYLDNENKTRRQGTFDGEPPLASGLWEAGLSEA